MKKSNRLIESSSPYLLQHAYNPVDWFPWGPEALNKARNEDKPIIVSIGYSACHWCHVMEHESFENDDVASIMNSNFVCIKVDREERPDVDQVYMDAVQAMGLQGGWPLNVFLTPDQKPFYGGTYFPKEGWKQLLGSVSKAYQENRQKLEESAEQFTQHLNENELAKYGIGSRSADAKKEIFDEAFQVIKQRFDKQWGGLQKAPKFPMPSIWSFLGKYGYFSKNQEALSHYEWTLERIADGGIYDHIGGGFARYAVDGEWHVPHFEKMLYDNGQLLTVYADGFKQTMNPRFKEVILQTVDWVEREMTHSSGGFYSALDADSEGEEGKFYVWTYEEIKHLAGENYIDICTYFDVTRGGNWEDGKNVLRVLTPKDEAIRNMERKSTEFVSVLGEFVNKALIEREKRVRPGLDDKILASWNGLMLRGLLDAYSATGYEKAKKLALDNAHFIKKHLINGSKLFRNHKNGISTIDAYLEDYCWVIDAFIRLYEITFDDEWINLAQSLLTETLDNFLDKSDDFFHFTSQEGELLIARKKELFDNVIPASNSGMAMNLWKLGKYLDQPEYQKIANKMLTSMSDLIRKEPEYLSHWACGLMDLVWPTAEVVIADNDKDVQSTIQKHYLPNTLFISAGSANVIPLAQQKIMLDAQPTYYVCFNKTCKLPVFDVNSAIEQIEQRN